MTDELERLVSNLAKTLGSTMEWATSAAVEYLRMAPPSKADLYAGILYTNLGVHGPLRTYDDQGGLNPEVLELARGARHAVYAQSNGPMRNKVVWIRIGGTDGQEMRSVLVAGRYGLRGCKGVDVTPDHLDESWLLEPLAAVIRGED